MFKKLETAWNSRTPVWLHNRTKENLIAQLIATGVFLGGMTAYNAWQDHKEMKRLKEDTKD